jgi:hypothetical protein
MHSYLKFRYSAIPADLENKVLDPEVEDANAVVSVLVSITYSMIIV